MGCLTELSTVRSTGLGCSGCNVDGVCFTLEMDCLDDGPLPAPLWPLVEGLDSVTPKNVVGLLARLCCRMWSSEMSDEDFLPDIGSNRRKF